jgi:type IV secretory pathway VirB2 component (pilin)
MQDRRGNGAIGTFAVFSGDGKIGPFSLNGVLNILLKIATNILSYMGLIAVIMIIIAGIIIVANGSNDGSRDRAKRIIIYTVIGLLIILLSSAIVRFATNAFTT